MLLCRKRLPSPRCRSELIDSAWVVIVPGPKNASKMHKTPQKYANLSNATLKTTT